MRGEDLRKGVITRKVSQEHRAALMKLFEKFRHQFDVWQVWDDLMYFCAAALAQPCQWVQAREDEYLRRIKRYPKDLQELFPTMFAEIVLAFEWEGFADILGSMYMEMGLGNHRRGQYFTPYEVALMMAKVAGENPTEQIKESGYISINDCACGSGVMLIAFAQNAIDCGVNYQTDVLFVGQDVDAVVARMCFIQLSLLGCAGYVIIGNTFTQPALGHVLMPSTSDSDVWFTPMYFRREWEWRRVWLQVGRLMDAVKSEKL